MSGAGGPAWQTVSPTHGRAELCPVENGTTTELARAVTFAGDVRVEIRAARGVFERAGLRVEARKRGELVVVAELRAVDGATERAQGFVVDLERHRKRVAVLAAVRERK